MKSLLAAFMFCAMCGISYGQNVVNYGYGPVVVQPTHPVVVTQPVVVYKPVVVYQPVQVLVPVVQQVLVPVYIVPPVRRYWIQQYQIVYYYQ